MTPVVTALCRDRKDRRALYENKIATLAQLAAYPNVIDGVLAKADKIRATAMELS